MWYRRAEEKKYVAELELAELENGKADIASPNPTEALASACAGCVRIHGSRLFPARVPYSKGEGFADGRTWWNEQDKKRKTFNIAEK